MWCFNIKNAISAFIILMMFNQCVYCLKNSAEKSELDFSYHRYDSMTTYLKRFEKRFPNLATLYSIGNSSSRNPNQRKKLWVMKISTSKSNDTLIGQIKLIANIHGNEAVGKEVLLHFIEYIGLNYDKDEKLKHILKHNNIHILPSMNPDGFEISTAECSSDYGRDNERGTDLNRSFPDYFQHNGVPLQSETKAIINWMNENYFILSASLHGGALVANYPFENVKERFSFSPTQDSLTEDDQVFRYLASVYSNTHPTMHKGNNCGNHTFPGGITNGAAWYILVGGMQDYNYAFHGCMEITLEISCCKYPQSSHLKRLWVENKNALVEYCLQASLGVKGIVIDEQTNMPIVNASLIVQGINMTFYTKKKGEFFRILLPGKYRLTIDADDYTRITKNFEVFPTVKYPQMTELKILLKRGEDQDDNLIESTTAIMESEETTECDITTFKNEDLVYPIRATEDAKPLYLSSGNIMLLNQWMISVVIVFSAQIFQLCW